jgi:hypothetical protein
MTMRNLLLFLCAAIAAPCLAAGVPADAPVVRTVEAWADVDEAGRVVRLDFDRGTPAPIRDLAEATFRALEFQPATRGGEPAPSRTGLRTKIEFTHDGAGGYVSKVLEIVQPGSRAANLSPPRYSVQAVRNGVGGIVWLDIVVRPDGRVDPERLSVHAARFHRRGKPHDGQLGRQLAESALQTAKDWTFHQPRVAGQPIATRQRVPVIFTPPGFDGAERWRQEQGEFGRDTPSEAQSTQGDYRLARLVESGAAAQD